MGKGKQAIKKRNKTARKKTRTKNSEYAKLTFKALENLKAPRYREWMYGKFKKKVTVNKIKNYYMVKDKDGNLKWSPSDEAKEFDTVYRLDRPKGMRYSNGVKGPLQVINYVIFKTLQSRVEQRFPPKKLITTEDVVDVMKTGFSSKVWDIHLNVINKNIELEEQIKKDKKRKRKRKKRKKKKKKSKKKKKEKKESDDDEEEQEEIEIKMGTGTF